MVEELYHRTPDATIKTRCQIILLSAKAMSVPQIAHADQVELVTLPTYSPKLNPARRFWKHLRRKVTHNTFFQTIDRLLDAVTGFLRDMVACPQTVRSVAG